MVLRAFFVAASLAFLFAGFPNALVSEEVDPSKNSSQEVHRWIDAMKGIDPQALSHQQKREKEEEMERACQELERLGGPAAEQIRLELRRSIHDSYFLLWGSAALARVEKEGWEPAAAEALAKAKLETDIVRYYTLASFIARPQQPYALPVIEKVLNVWDHVPNEETILRREELLIFVAGTYGPGCVERVATHIFDDSLAVRLNVVLLLEWFAADAYGPKLLKLLQEDSSELVRTQAARALGVMLYAPASEALAASAGQDPDPGVKKQCVWALAELLDKRGMGACVAALDDSAPEVRQEAISSLVLMQSLAGARALATRLAKERDEGLTGLLLRGLAELGYAETLSAVKNLKVEPGSELERVRSRAQEAIEKRNFTEDRGIPKQLTSDVKPLPDVEFRKLLATLFEKTGHGAAEQRNVLCASATEAHIPELERVRARTLWRLSDECFYDTQALTMAIRYARLKKYLASMEKQQQERTLGVERIP